MDQKILFLHGLEAGINGAKGLFLRKEFKDNCICPDLEVSKFKIYLKNCFLRKAILNPIFIGFSSISFLFSYILYTNSNIFYSLVSGMIAFLLFFKFSMKYLIRSAITKAMENNIEVAYSKIKKHNPKIIIGSSWGGAVLTNLIERGHWKGHSILIAPAYYEINKYIHFSDPGKIKKFKLRDSIDHQGKIIVYHSMIDDLIPYEDSKILCGIDQEIFEKNSNFENIELKEVKNDDHALNSLIEGPKYILKNEILELFKI